MWPSLFIFFSTPDGCCLFPNGHLGIAGVFFFLQLWMGTVSFQFPTCNTNVAWHGHPHPKQYTLSNARDTLIAKLTTFNSVTLSGTERLRNEAQNVFTCGGGGVKVGDDGASCKGNEVGIPFQMC